GIVRLKPCLDFLSEVGPYKIMDGILWPIVEVVTSALEEMNLSEDTIIKRQRTV
ncbi:hypothetical protein HN51_035638, partial [Arachis hypogaea]